MGEYAIGQSVSRFEDPRLLKGGGRYVGDMVLPGMVFGYVLRSPHAHARIRSIDTSKAKAAPGVLAVLTGDDWQASGWGDLPVPDGLKRRDGSVFRPPYPALTKDRVRWVGDYVAFVVAETYHQALDAAELIVADYEPLPATVSTADASADGAARVWDDCPDNIGFVQLFGDKAATEAAFAKADHVVKHRLVINRVTAASMEPRGCLGDYNAAEDRYTIYTTLQRVHPFRAELSPVLQVPESKIRVVAGDIGGSFGMKSAVYNEVALVLLASKHVGRPVKWMSTRSESFLCDAQARDNVTQAELALDKQGRFLAMRATVDRQHRCLSADRNARLHRQYRHARGRLSHSRHACRCHGRVHAHQSGSALSRQRPPGGRLCDRAACRSRRRRARDRSRRAAAAKLHSARRHAVQDRRSRSPTTAASSRRAWTWRSSSPTSRASNSAARNRASTASCAASASPTPSSGRPRRVSKARRSGSTNPAPSRCSRAASPRARATRPSSSRSCATASASIPNEVHYVQGDTDQVFLGEGTGGSRSATIGGSAVDMAAERITTKAKQIAAHLLKVDAADINFADGVFSSPKTNRTLTIKEVAKEAMEPVEAAEGHGRRPDRDRDLHRAGAEFPQRLPHLRARDRRGDRQLSRSCATAWWTTSAPSSIRCC